MVKVRNLYAHLKIHFLWQNPGMLDQEIDTLSETDTLSRLLTLIDAKCSPEKL